MVSILFSRVHKLENRKKVHCCARIFAITYYLFSHGDLRYGVELPTLVGILLRTYLPSTGALRSIKGVEDGTESNQSNQTEKRTKQGRMIRLNCRRTGKAAAVPQST